MPVGVVGVGVGVCVVGGGVCAVRVAVGNAAVGGSGGVSTVGVGAVVAVGG